MANAHPRISVLMLTYNRPQLIGRAVASVCNQAFADWELIIVQDGDNPETGRLLEEWLVKEPRIRYLQRGTVGSIAEASNFGLRAARGEYIAVLDDDDCWNCPDKLARQVEFLDANPEYVGCGGGYVLVDQEGRKRGKLLKPEKDAAIRARALLANPVVNSTALFRRVVNGEAVAYDLSMRQFADWDFWLTMGARGKLYNFPMCLAHYAIWEGGSSFRAQRANGLAALRIVWKHRREYRGFWMAAMLAGLYLGYAWLPTELRRASYTSLSAMKKALASAGAAG
jgi:glycosyltransferase involved in cell wall biosynthesis